MSATGGGELQWKVWSWEQDPGLVAQMSQEDGKPCSSWPGRGDWHNLRSVLTELLKASWEKAKRVEKHKIFAHSNS